MYGLRSRNSAFHAASAQIFARPACVRKAGRCLMVTVFWAAFGKSQLAITPTKH